MSMNVSCDVPGCASRASAEMVAYEGGQLPEGWHSLDEDRCACPDHDSDLIQVLAGLSYLQLGLQDIEQGDFSYQRLLWSYEHLRAGRVIAWECAIPGCATRMLGRPQEPPEGWTLLGLRYGCAEHARLIELLNGIRDLSSALWVLCNEPLPVKKSRRCCQQRDETRNDALSHWLPRATAHLRAAAA